MEAGIGVGGLSLGKDEVASSGFDVFSPIEYETSIVESTTETYNPISNTSNKGPFKFTIQPDPEKWTDCESLRLHGKMRIRKKVANATSNIDNTDEIGTIDNIFHSLWSNVRVILNNTEITDPAGKWYSYKSLLETKLSYSSKTKDNILLSRGFAQDTADKFVDFGTPAAGNDAAVASKNEGWLTRKEWFKDSAWVYFCINLHSDITTLRNYLPPNIKMQIEFERNPDSFCLLGKEVQNKSYFIDLEDLHMTLKRYEPSDEMKEFYERNLRNGNKARLPIDRSIIKTYTVNANKKDLSEFNIIAGTQLPDQVIIGIVSEKSYEGSIDTNPYQFKDYDLSQASLVVKGHHEPQELYRMNKTDKDTADIWAHFLENTGVQTDDREFGLTKKDYLGGTFLLAWDRSPDKCNRFHRHVMKGGTMDINLKLHTALPETATVLIYATYSTDLVIDSNGNVMKYMF